MSEYEVYWLMYFPLINSNAHLERISYNLSYEAKCIKVSKQV